MCLIQWEKTIIYCKWAPASFRFHVLKMLGVPAPAPFFLYPGEVPVPFSTIICDKFLWWFNNILPKSLPPELQKLTDEFDPWTVRRAGSDRKNRLVDGWPTPIGIECGGMFNGWVSITKLAACVKGLIQSQNTRLFFETQQLRMGLPRNTRPSQEATSFHTLSFVSGVGLIHPGWILTPGRKALWLMVCIRKCPNSLNSWS